MEKSKMDKVDKEKRDHLPKLSLYGEEKQGLDKYKKCKKYMYVNVANPIMLGIYIGIGMFIVLPLFVIGIMILLAIFGLSL